MKQTQPNPPWSVGLALLAVLLLTAPVAADLLDDADRAWAAENYDQALALYDRVLADTPDHYRALMRTGKMLAWEDRLDESIPRYERALESKPADRDAGLGYAVALSWDGQLDRSIDTLAGLAQRHPADREILLALARVQNWDGRYLDARSTYEQLLSSDPGDIGAMLGTAQTYAWSGRLAAARVWYNRVLTADAGNKDARVGLANLDLWTGAIGSAAQSTRALHSEYADDSDVEKLYTQVSRVAGAWASLDLSRVDDTDDNVLDSYRLSGGLGLGRGVRLELGYGRYEMSNQTADASIDNLNASIHFRPRHGEQFSVEVGSDRRTRTDSSTDSDLLGGLRYRWGLDRRWQLQASAMRTAIRYSPLITDNGILYDGLELGATGALGERFRIHLTAGTSDFSDGNDRVHALAGFTYRVPVRKTNLQVGYTARFMDYDSDLPNGYFDPQDFLAHLARLTVRGEFGQRVNNYSAYLTAGVQSFTVGGTDVNNDTVLVVGGQLGFPLKNGFGLEVYAEYADAAAANPGGFESTTAGVRLTWRDGLD